MNGCRLYHVCYSNLHLLCSHVSPSLEHFPHSHSIGICVFGKKDNSHSYRVLLELCLAMKQFALGEFSFVYNVYTKWWSETSLLNLQKTIACK